MNTPIDTISDTKRRLRNTRIALVVLTILFFADLIGSYGIYEENIELKSNIEVLESELNLYNSSAIYWKEKCEHYQSANKALIKHAEPKSLDKAIKATPLPPIGV